MNRLFKLLLVLAFTMQALAFTGCMYVDKDDDPDHKTVIIKE